MAKQDIQEILEKINSGIYTRDEGNAAKLWLFQLHSQKQADLSESKITEASERIWLRLQNDVQHPKPKTLWPGLIRAAAILLLIGSTSL